MNNEGCHMCLKISSDENHVFIPINMLMFFYITQETPSAINTSKHAEATKPIVNLCKLGASKVNLNPHQDTEREFA